MSWTGAFCARLLREPLFHFLLIGSALFALHGAIGKPEEPQAGDRIVVTGEQIERLGALWEKRWRRPPTTEELAGLIEEQVREEVLYRQALALGLDREDPVIRRHLRQKFEFLTQDLTAMREPDLTELALWFEVNSERYRRAARYSFTQVYFNLDRRGAAGEREALVTLAGLREGATYAPAGLGDSQILDHAYRDRTLDEIAALFGRDFADALPRLDAGSWSGPISSGLGLHLVRLDERKASEAPRLEEVVRQVRHDWSYEQRRLANEEVYRRLRDRYEVILEGGGPAASGPSGRERMP